MVMVVNTCTMGLPDYIEMSEPEDNATETTPILSAKTTPEKRKTGLASVNIRTLRFTTRDKLLLGVSFCTIFGDAVEVYLPGIFTQNVSSALQLTQTEEGLLAISMAVFMFLSSIVVAPLLRRFNRRRIILTSLYTTILGTLLSTLVPNYATLLFTRCLRGAAVAINFAVVGVFFATNASAYDVYNFGSFIGVLIFAVGSGWSAVLGYFLLNYVGWRALVICASVPAFIPAIIILHFFLSDQSSHGDQISSDQSSSDQSSDDQSSDEKERGEKIDATDLKWRLVKGSTANFINFLQGWGSIILAPALIRACNAASHKKDTNVEGTQLLILALIFGGVKIIGRLIGYFLLKHIPFRVLHPVVSIIIAVCYLAILIRQDILVLTVLCVGLANMAFCVSRIELTLMETDTTFFGMRHLPLLSSLMMAFGSLGAAVGAVFAAFLPSYYAVVITFALSCVQVLVFISITER